ncbi:MAG: hypothetical protein CVU38_01685 [Chloroflexi bacterium HGW-Chloroflexi-1]|nr:MAG: hypothetical protein CVU38_01685 [Chloroflexi bacterium HGW-Chloroflexi-1]
MANVLVVYHSQEYGNTAVMAEAVAEGLRAAGCDVDLFNTNEGRFDITRFPQYAGVAFGSPDYDGYLAGGLKTFLDDHYIYKVHTQLQGITGKPYVLFYSHGGGGKVKEALISVLKHYGIGALVAEPVGSHGRPTPQVQEQCISLGKLLAEAILT